MFLCVRFFLICSSVLHLRCDVALESSLRLYGVFLIVIVFCWVFSLCRSLLVVGGWSRGCFVSVICGGG